MFVFPLNFSVVWVAMLALGLFTGCSSVRVAHKDPTFTYQALQSGGLAVGAVTKPDTINYYAEKPIAEFFHARLSRAWPQVEVLPMEDVENTLGTNGFRQLKLSFHETGSLEPGAFSLLEPVQAKVRYLLMVDMRADDSHSYDVTGYKPEYDAFYNPHTQRYEMYQTGGEFLRTRGSSRSIHTAFVIYDLETGRPAWAGTTSASGGFANSDTDWLFIPDVRGTGIYSPTDLLESIGDDFVKKLPRPGKWETFTGYYNRLT